MNDEPAPHWVSHWVQTPIDGVTDLNQPSQRTDFADELVADGARSDVEATRSLGEDDAPAGQSDRQWHVDVVEDRLRRNHRHVGRPDCVQGSCHLHHGARARFAPAKKALVGPVGVAPDSQIARDGADGGIGEVGHELTNRVGR